MSDHPYVNLLAACILAIPAVLSYLQGLRNGKAVKVVVEKADEIHGLVNSAMSAVKADLALANQRIAALQNLVNEITADRERLHTQAAAAAAAAAAQP